jgi:hypothetical protein
MSGLLKGVKKPLSMIIIMAAGNAVGFVSYCSGKIE